MIFKCKMCGATLNVEDGKTIAKCEYCGSIQTIPKIDSDKIQRLFERANEYRFNNDFDKAYSVYEALTFENPNEAEAYWGLVLSEFGVEYVDDIKTNKKVPTCHRTIDGSILNNGNYLKAIEKSDTENRFIYQDEAELIDSIQKKIKFISARETPYDVFICYKETNDVGERSEDSIIAQDIYNVLTKEGLKVFFSRVTLDGKLGIDFEPYIYSALNTSKVMLVISTNYEHLESTWVKNEWKRFISFANNDISKILVPVLKGIEPNILPIELQKYQCLDLNKIGAIQDLLHICKKYTLNIEENLQDKALRSLIAEQAKKEAQLLKEQEEKKRIAEEKQRRKEKRRIFLKKNMKKIVIAAVLAILIFIAIAKANSFIKYQTACKNMENGNYAEAKKDFIELDGFLSSDIKALESENAICNLEFEKNKTNKTYYKLKDLLKECNRVIETKKCSDKELKTIINIKENLASLFESINRFEDAKNIYISLNYFGDYSERINECEYRICVEAFNNKVNPSINKKELFDRLNSLATINYKDSKDYFEKLSNETR